MKKGFIFIETLVVLTVLSLSIVGLYGMYIKVSTDIKEKKYYDNIDDLYKTDIIRKITNKDSLPNEEIIKINSSNCTSFMNLNCTSILNTLEVEEVIILNANIDSLINNENTNIKNSLKEYLKTINKDEITRYIILNYKYADKNFYASLKI